jgi:hypothetical protein
MPAGIGIARLAGHLFRRVEEKGISDLEKNPSKEKCTSSPNITSYIIDKYIILILWHK